MNTRIVTFFLEKIARAFSYLDKRKNRFVLRITENIHARLKRSYSLFGEDLVIDGILKRIKYETKKELTLSYVDIGAWRPIAGSNTYFLYKRGVHGTVVEPNPHMAYRWGKLRSNDQYLNFGVGVASKQDFFLFEENSPANSFDVNFVKEISAKESVNVGSVVQIECKTLEDILKMHLSANTGDYILDIDVEGMDYDVLTTFDFESLHRPILMSIEDTESPIISSRINAYLNSKHYFLLGRTVLTSIYGDRKRIELRALASIV